PTGRPRSSFPRYDRTLQARRASCTDVYCAGRAGRIHRSPAAFYRAPCGRRAVDRGWTTGSSARTGVAWSSIAHRLGHRGLRMSVALFDLGQRLRAAADARPVARSAFAPVLPPVDPVAVTITGSGDSALLRATDGVRQVATSGHDALSALNELGVAASSD